jgi:membrane-bound serine protease (ClpP class)
LAFLLGSAIQAADEQPAPAAAPAADRNVGAFVTLPGTISDSVTATVRRTALELQTRALKENRQAYLVLELTGGTSEFHHVFALTEFLASEATANLTTICWIPKTLNGTNLCVALACNEIVVHPDAKVGDIGRGEALSDSEQTIVKSIVAKRRNRRVSDALAIGLMDPKATILQITVEPVPGAVEKRLVTQEEAQRMRDAGIAIRDSQTIKDKGPPWTLTANQATEWGILIARMANNRKEITDAYALPVDAMRERPVLEGNQHVELIEIHGPIEPILASFLHRQIERAIDAGAKIIIFDVNSPGGRLLESEELAFAISDLKGRGVHAVAYVPRTAYSGAAIISLGADDIYMHPEADIGDAGAIAELQAGGGFEHVPEKLLSPLRETLSELARKKGRPEALVQAMSKKDMKVFQVTHKTKGTVTYMSEEEIHEKGDEWIKGPQVRESGTGFLTLNGQRASELQLAQQPVDSLDDLKLRLGIPADQRLVAMKRTWVDDTVFILNAPVVMGLLFFFGLVAIYVELHTLTGIFGLVSAICFGLFFWSKVLGGTAGSLEIVLFILGVFGVTGILLILASIIMASQTFGHLGPNMSDLGESAKTLKIFGGAVLGLIVTAVALAKYLPSIPLFSDMILTPPGEAEAAAPRLKPELVSGTASLLGQSGVTKTLLRPSGKAEIDGQYVDVISEGEYIPEGSTIQVVDCSGNRVVVRRV